MKVSPLIRYRIPLTIATLVTGVLVIACQSNPQVQPSPSPIQLPTQSGVLPATTATAERRIPVRRSGSQPYAPYLDLLLLRASSEPTSLQMPAAIEATLVGREIISVTLVAGRYETGEEKRLVSSLPVRGGGLGELNEEGWPDGIHELSYVWQTEGDYLSDDSTGDFVLLQELDPAKDLWIARGRYRPSDSQRFESVELRIDRGSGEVLGIFAQHSSKAIRVESGAEFQVLDNYLDNSGNTTSRPGKILKFDEMGKLAFRRAPLPAGNYFLSFMASSITGSAATVTVDYLVGNENLLPGKRAYFQPEYGYQFLYPEDWSGFETSDDPVLSINVVPTLTLQIAIDPFLGVAGRGAGQSAILHSLGEVEVLYEDHFEMGLYGGLRTVYGYESSNGLRTGVLLTFSYDGTDYVLDVDGPTEDEQQILSAARSLIDSWIWRSFPETRGDHPWRLITIDDYRLYVPANYQYDLLNNGWQRLSDNQLNAFLAYRLDGQSNSSPESKLLYWETVASRDVNDFYRSDIYEQQLAGVPWLRIDFQYDSKDLGEIWGAIMSWASDSGELIAWMEAPAADFMRLEEEQLSLMLANLVRRQ